MNFIDKFRQRKLVLILVSIIMAVFFLFYSSLVDLSRKELLKAELQNLRISLEVYKNAKGKYPENLKNLVSFFKEKERPHGYLRVDKEGYPLDVYNNRFIYDKISGIVRSKKDLLDKNAFN